MILLNAFRKAISRVLGPLWVRPVIGTTIAIILWGMNSLEIQTIYYEMTTNVAVSSQRIPNLVEQLRKPSREAVFQLIDCKLDRDKPPVSDLCTARIRARVRKYSHLDRIEEELESMTRPIHDSKDCEQKASELRHARWELETIHHGLQVALADRERFKRLSEELPEPRGTSNVHLVGHRHEAKDESGSDTLATDTLLATLDRDLLMQQKLVASLTVELEGLRSRSKGFFSFSGAQRVYPVVPCVAIEKAAVLVFMSGSIWILVCVVYRWCTNQTTNQPQPISSVRKDHRQRTKSYDLGIPCLGTIAAVSVRPSTTIPNAVSDTSPTREPLKIQKKLRSHRRLPSWRLLPERAIALWFIVLTIRFIFDGVWRELFTAAPLAAITCLIGGVP